MVFISPFSGRLIGRFGARGLMTVGMLSAIAGLVVVLTRIAPDSPYALLLVGYPLSGIAIGLVYAPMSTAAMAAMPAEKVGIASGVLAMDRIVAGSLALAATGAAFHALQVSGDSFATSIPRSPARPGSRWRSARSAPSSPGPSFATLRSLWTKQRRSTITCPPPIPPLAAFAALG
jgi:MFS family permease